MFLFLSLIPYVTQGSAVMAPVPFSLLFLIPCMTLGRALWAPSTLLIDLYLMYVFVTSGRALIWSFRPLICMALDPSDPLSHSEFAVFLVTCRLISLALRFSTLVY